MAFCLSDDESLPIIGSSYKNKETFTIVDLTHHIMVNFLATWQEIERRNYPSTSFGPTTDCCPPCCLPMSTIAYNSGSPLVMEALPLPQTKSWSFHLPLHRFVAACLREVARRDKTIRSNGFGEIEIEKLLTRITQSESVNGAMKLYTGLMEYPIIVFARAAQVRAGLWRRNGAGMFDQVSYESDHYNENR